MAKLKPEDVIKLQEENAQLKKSIEDLWTINQLARIISTTMPVNEILDKVVSVSRKAIGAAQGTISLLDDQVSDDPFKTLIRKADTTQFDRKYRLDQDLSGWMLKHRKSLMINDFKNNSTFKSQEHSQVKEIESLLSVPLLCKGKLIGVLNLFNKRGSDKAVHDFTKNDQRLLSIIASQSAQVIENARLYEQEKQLQQMEQEMETAREIQTRLLPKEPPAIAGFEVVGMSEAAKKVGGDYFDFIQLDDDRWVIVLGDVSGKGIAASLLMSSLHATLRSQAISANSLVECIERTNLFLHINTESTKFVTLFAGVLNAKKKTFTYVNAGHNFPLFLSGGVCHQLGAGGLMLGILPDTTFEQEEVKVKSGDILVIYSDGVTEAENELEDMYGEKRLQNLIEQSRSDSAETVMKKIYSAVKEFEGPNKQDDDITLVVVKAH